MLFRAGKKYSKDVSIYEPIGTDKDGETVSLVDVLEVDEKEALDSIILKQDIQMLYEVYERDLKDTEKTVLRMRYGLLGSKEYTQREIAAKLGISRSYVSRIENGPWRRYGQSLKNMDEENRDKQGCRPG